MWLWLIQNGRAQVNKPRAQGCEHRGNLCPCRAWLIIIEKRIIAIATCGQCVRLLLAQPHDLCQDRQVGCHIIIGGDLHSAVIIALDMSQIGGRHSIGCRGFVQPITNTWINPPCVQH